MKKYFLFFLILSLFAAVGCGDEAIKSRYTPDFGEVEPWEEGGTVELKTGIVNASLRMDLERRSFKYFMPDNLKSEGVSIIFDFHGHLTYDPNNDRDLLGGFNEYNDFAKLAKTENFIVVKPLGSVVSDLKVIGWNDEELNAKFFDKMVKYFKAGCPALDMNRIYVTGVSSGGIFSFGLASLRSDVIAASVPVAGQYSMGADFIKPNKAVPIRTYIGSKDPIVDYQSAYENLFMWANSIAGCTKDNFEKSTTSIYIPGQRNTFDVEVTKWTNGTAPMEFYLVKDLGHNEVDAASTWEFMKANPKK